MQQPGQRDPALDYPDNNPRPAADDGPCPVPACEYRETCDPVRHCNLRDAWEVDPEAIERRRSQSEARPFEERLLATFRWPEELDRGRREWKALRRLPGLPGDATGTFDATVGRR